VAGEQRRRRLRALLTLAGVAGGDANMTAFDAAFVHESAVRERLAARSNERLEFLGDAILGNVVARSLFERYRDAAEGELALRKAALVSDTALATTAERLGFGELLVLGAGLANSAPARRRSALGDAFEAFLAVLYREAGDAAVVAFVASEHIAPFEALGADLEDPKSVLQEWTQRRGAGVPAYFDRFEGPDHERTFFANVTVDGDLSAEGSGASKKAAQRAAAARALELLAERHGDVRPRPLSEASSVAASTQKRAPRRPVRRSKPGGEPGAKGVQTKGSAASNRRRS
jgi:ribonuclease-3